MKNKCLIGYKILWEKENYLLLAISPFHTMFSTAIYISCVKMWHCVVMGLKEFWFKGCGAFMSR